MDREVGEPCVPPWRLLQVVSSRSLINAPPLCQPAGDAAGPPLCTLLVPYPEKSRCAWGKEPTNKVLLTIREVQTMRSSEPPSGHWAEAKSRIPTRHDPTASFLPVAADGGPPPDPERARSRCDHSCSEARGQSSVSCRLLQASVQPTADPPQTVRIQIAVRTPKTCDDEEHFTWGRVGDSLTDVAKNAVPPNKDVRRTGSNSRSERMIRQRAGQGFFDGSGITHGLNCREQFSRSGAFADDFRAQALDQWAGDRGGDWGH